MKKTPNELHTGIAAKISEKLGYAVITQAFAQDELVITVKPAELNKVMTALRDDAEFMFEQLVDITATDYPAKADRFEVVYSLLSIRLNARIRVKVITDEDTPVASVVPQFSSAIWLEREVWDMYGIVFEGNDDLRRILTDYGFDGHPLRKDFPLTGYVEMRYDETEKRVVYEPVTLQQDFRVFDNLSPWEAMTTVQLPGDEKATTQKIGPKNYRQKGAE